MRLDARNFLMHYGTPRHSGRYPWGSGGDDNPTPRSPDRRDHYNELKSNGLSEVEIARGMGMSTTELRAWKAIDKAEAKQANISEAVKLREKGMSTSAIARTMGIPEPTMRALLKDSTKDKADILHSTASMLKDQVAEKNFVDVGTGVENQLGISSTKLGAAVSLLKEQGYVVHTVQVEQLGTVAGKKTSIKVLAPPGTTYRDVASNTDKIQQVTNFSDDGGRTFFGIQPPLSIKADRVGVLYRDEGGKDADGVIYVRRGVDDISLGGSRYAQVRVMVNGTHYIKGMAMYKDDMPDGVDLLFNTKKTPTGNKLDALKEASVEDKQNPFGASIRRQLIEKDASGKERVTSAMNIINEEGNWDQWSKNLSAQTLSKQSPALAKTQLDMSYERQKKDFDAIMSMTNPAVRKRLLTAFAETTDAAAVHLKAAALPSSSWHVLLPMEKMKETEIYAPNFKNGERVALIRYPHGGTFEIPELTVNNNFREAKAVIGRAKDAVVIHPKVADRLSGADFDGDAVLVIPNSKGSIRTTPALEDLKGFDAQLRYPMPKGTEFKGNKQQLMGDVSNLITDMTIHGAGTDDLVRAVKHSMVVIDAEKHNLNYKQSAIDFNIRQLKQKYQTKLNEDGTKQPGLGASTLISRAKSDIRVPERKLRPASQGGPVDKQTGKLVYVETGNSYVNAQGKTVVLKTKSTKLAVTDDAHTLSSGTRMEEVYANYSNKTKDLANKARLAEVHTGGQVYSPSAKTAYQKEVASLNAKLNLAIQNRPLERQAQIIGNAEYKVKRAANPNMTEAEKKKVKAQALEKARARTQAKKHQIYIEDSEWAAIQAGAITNNKLTDILRNADLDRLKKIATPKTHLLMTSAKTTRAKSMVASGYTQAEIAEALGVSLTTLKTTLEGE